MKHVKKMTDLEKKAIDIAKREVLRKLADEEPYLFGDNGLYHQMHNYKAQLYNGVIAVQLRVKDGFVTDIVLTETKRFVFKKTIDNSEADQ